MKTSTRSILPSKFLFNRFVLLFLVFLHFFCSISAQVSQYPRLQIDLLLNTNGGAENSADGVMIFYNDHFSAGIGYEDSYKFTNPDENLGIFCAGKILTIDGKPPVTTTDTIILQMWQFRQKSYVFKISGSNFSSELVAVLKDSYLQKDIPINLSSETLVPFSLTDDSASYALNRFSVIFKTKATSPPFAKGKFGLAINSLTVFPNPIKGNIINLKMNDMKAGSYLATLYNLSGQQVYSRSISYEGGSATKSLILDRKVSKGIYKLQLSLNGIITNKLVVFQ